MRITSKCCTQLELIICLLVPMIVLAPTSQGSQVKVELGPKLSGPTGGRAPPVGASGGGQLQRQPPDLAKVVMAVEQAQLQDRRVMRESLQLGGICALKRSCPKEPVIIDKPSCYCDQKCIAYDDCCQDSRWAEQLAGRVELGVGKLHERRRQWQCKRINPIYGDVLVRAQCDPVWLQAQTNTSQAELIRERCEFGATIEGSRQNEPVARGNRSDATSAGPDWGPQADPLGSLMPITDLETGITYANSYCLRCNTMQRLNDGKQQQQRQQQQQRGAKAAPKRTPSRLIFWSPLVKCNYNLDSDDSDILFDLISSKKGHALKYSHKRRRWLIRMQPLSASNATTNMNTNATGELQKFSNSTSAKVGPASGGRQLWEDDDANEKGAPNGGERVCTIMPTVPESIEHLVRHCQLNTIDSCPTAHPSVSTIQQVGAIGTINRDELQRAQFECQFGHQALVYSLDTNLVYYNLACAKCNNERNVHCERYKPIRHHMRIITTPRGQAANRSTAGAAYPVSPLDEPMKLPEDTGEHNDNDHNGDSGDDMPDVARSRSSSNPAGATSGSFSVLMDLYGGFRGGSDHWDQLVGSAHQCEDAQQQVYDPFLLTCRDIICGLNHRFVDGSCVLVEQEQEQQEQKQQQQADSSNGRQQGDSNLFADPSSGGHDERQQTTTAAAAAGHQKQHQHQLDKTESLLLVGSSGKQERVEDAHSRGNGTSGGQANSGALDPLGDKQSSSSGASESELQLSFNGRPVHQVSTSDTDKLPVALAQQQEQAASGASSTAGDKAPDSRVEPVLLSGDRRQRHGNDSAVAATSQSGQESLPQPPPATTTTPTTSLTASVGGGGGRLVFAADRRAETSAKLSQLDSGAPNRTGTASFMTTVQQQPQQQQPASDYESTNYDLSVGDILARLNLDELPLASGESRRLFAKCAKIFIKPEHYRLFTAADLINYKRGQSSSASTNSSESSSAAQVQPPSSSELRDPNANADQNNNESKPRAGALTTTGGGAKPTTNHLGDVWAFVAPYNLTLASSQFELVHSFAVTGQQQQSGSDAPSSAAIDSDQFHLLVCSPFKTDLADKFTPTMVYLTTGCLVVSIASLTCYLLLYCLATFDLRHMVVELCHANQTTGTGWLNKRISMNLTCRGSRASNETSYNAARSHSLSSRGVACLAAALLAAYLLFILGHHQQQQHQQQLQLVHRHQQQQQQQGHHHHQLELAEVGSSSERQLPAQLTTTTTATSDHNETVTGANATSNAGQESHATAASLSSCELIAAGTYCFFLLAFNWMFLLSYDIWRALRLATYHFRAPAMGSQSRRFLVYASLAITSATTIAALALALDHIDSAPAAEDGLLLELERFAQLYRPKFGQRAGSCWFSNRRSLALFFGLPVTLVSLVNLIFFFHISFMVIRTSSDSAGTSSFTSSKSTAATTTTTTSSSGKGALHEQAESQLDFAQQNSLTTSSISSVRTIQSNLSLESTSSQLGDKNVCCSSDSSDNGHDQDSDDTGVGVDVESRGKNLVAVGGGGGEAEERGGAAPLDPRDGAAGAKNVGPSPSRASTIAYFDSAQNGPQPEGAVGCCGEIGGQQQRQQQTELHRQMKLLAESEMRRASFRNNRFAPDMMSSSSLLSSSNQSTCQSSLNLSLGSNLALKYDQQKRNLTLFMSSIAKDYRLYCRLSTIMGLTWLTGLLASLVDQSDTLWYLFVLLNTLQGLFIFIAFGFKRSRLANLEILAKYLAYKLAKAISFGGGGSGKANKESGQNKQVKQVDKPGGDKISSHSSD